MITFCMTTNASNELANDSKSAILIESTTGEIVFSKDENTRRSPASMTKIMSLKIILDCYNDNRFTMDDLVTTS